MTDKEEIIKCTNFNLEYNSLITMNVEGKQRILQFNHFEDDHVRYQMYYKGNKMDCEILSPRQFGLYQHMPEPQVIDLAKNVLSPMPGTMVEIKVKDGDKIMDGQDLAVIEAMKMQNVLKSEVEGVVKKVHVKTGDNVGVDQLLIEFE